MIKGQLFHALAEKNISATRPMFAFVPNYLFKNNKFLAREYSLRGWDSINCGANKHAIGSHVFPDLSKPILSLNTNPTNPTFHSELKEFITNLKKFIQKNKSRLDDFKKPGKQKTGELKDTLIN